MGDLIELLGGELLGGDYFEYLIESFLASGGGCLLETVDTAP